VIAHVEAGQGRWRPLLRLLGPFLVLSTLLVIAWLTGGRDAGARTRHAELFMAPSLPLALTAVVLTGLRNPSERTWILATPTLMLLAFGAPHGAAGPWSSLLVSASLGVALVGSLRRERVLVAIAAAVCGLSSAWVELAAALAE
jgi:hypothetical protein